MKAVPQKAHRKPLRLALFTLLAVAIVEFSALMLLNGGHFVFTLDDPYIHLALADHISRGHYGINMGEFSSPSSSLLWPFLLVPISRALFSSYGILVLNLLCATGTVGVFWKVLTPGSSQASEKNTRLQTFFTCTLIALIFATNLIALIYTGMEHSLQVFLSCVIVMGLIHETERRTAPGWLFAALVIAPWIRFECLALSLPALTLLYLRGYRAKSVLAAIIVLGIIGVFAAFLVHLGLDPIALSITAKSPFLNSERGLKAFYDVLCANLSSFKGILLALGALFLFCVAFASKRKKREKALAGTLAVSISLHLCAGQLGGRYEVYIVAAMLLAVLYLIKDRLYAIPFKLGLCPAIGLLVLSVSLLFFPYLKEVWTLPIASNNIYQQQYQMRRFVLEYYQKPVAVNDLGLVSYGNENYVLDLWGLASKEALQDRRKNIPPIAWIPGLAERHHVQFAMIYDDWFFSRTPEGRYAIPEGWRKLGELQLGRKRITPAGSRVSFYALTPEAAGEIRPLLLEFRETLPKGVVFDLAGGSDSGQ